MDLTCPQHREKYGNYKIFYVQAILKLIISESLSRVCIMCLCVHVGKCMSVCLCASACAVFMYTHVWEDYLSMPGMYRDYRLI